MVQSHGLITKNCRGQLISLLNHPLKGNPGEDVPSLISPSSTISPLFDQVSSPKTPKDNQNLALGQHIESASDEDYSSCNPPFKQHDTSSLKATKVDGTSGVGQKYYCNYPGCGKGFTTSGHLSRHNRIHTGEKRYSCLMEGCTSRFSRQDNMMQHFRTHFSPKPKRNHHRQQYSPENYIASVANIPKEGDNPIAKKKPAIPQHYKANSTWRYMLPLYFNRWSKPYPHSATGLAPLQPAVCGTRASPRMTIETKFYKSSVFPISS